MSESPNDPATPAAPFPGYSSLWDVSQSLSSQKAKAISAETLAQLDNYRKLEEMTERGELDEFQGEYVVVLGGKLIGHNTDGAALLKRVAEEHGTLASQAALRYLS